MKKSKTWMSFIVGASLLVLPLTSVISCSKNNNINDTFPEPEKSGEDENEKPKLIFESNLNEIDYEKDGWKETDHYDNDYNYKFLKDEDVKLISSKIKNNEIKFFDENDKKIKYRISIKINPGLIMTNFKGTDINKPYNNIVDDEDDEIMLRTIDNSSKNVWKRLSESTFVYFDFEKKENNNSFKFEDFELKFAYPDSFSPVSKYSGAFDINSNVSDWYTENEANFLGIKVIDNNIYFSNINLEYPQFENIKDKYMEKDSQNTNYLKSFKIPEGQPWWDLGSMSNYISNISGTITIEEIE